MAEGLREDRYLTNFSTAYRVEGGVGDFIAPPFSVKRYAGRYSTWDKSNQRVYDAKVVGREKAKEISQSVSYGEYTCERYKLADYLTDHDRDNYDIPVNAEQKKIQLLKDAMMVAREKRVFSIAGNASVVTQTGTPSNKWDNITSGTPVSDIISKIAYVYEQAQVRPNRIVVPLPVALGIIKTDEWVDRFKSADKTVMLQFDDLLSPLRSLGLEVRIAGVFGGNTNPGGSSDPGSELMWGEEVLLFYADSSPSLDSRAFMYSPYTYLDKVFRKYKDEEEATKFERREEIDELLVDATCAYLWTNTLT